MFSNTIFTSEENAGYVLAVSGLRRFFTVSCTQVADRPSPITASIYQ
jgi:hypothetical protein